MEHFSTTTIYTNSKPSNKKTPYKRPKSREEKTQHSSKMTDQIRLWTTKAYQKPYHYDGWSVTTINPNSKPFNKKKNSIQETKIQGRKNTTQQQDDRLNKALNDQTKPSHYGGWSMTKINPNSKPCDKKNSIQGTKIQKKKKKNAEARWQT
jgi:hypothetical protein